MGLPVREPAGSSNTRRARQDRCLLTARRREARREDLRVRHDRRGTGAYQLAGHRLYRVWQTSTPGTSPVIAGGLLYVDDETHGALNVREPRTGRQLASLPAGHGHWNSPIVVGGRIILPTGSANDRPSSGVLRSSISPDARQEGMPGTTAWVLADQLTTSNPALDGADRVLLVQSSGALRAKRFHRQKLHLVLVAMRHFARELEQRGVAVDHVRADSLPSGLRSVRAPAPTGASAADGAEERRRTDHAGHPSTGATAGRRDVPHRSGCSSALWAAPRGRLVMEDFYRDQRRRLGLLMDGDQPVGGRWNFDAENRRKPRGQLRPPRPYRPREDEHDDAVRDELDGAGIETWGEDGPRQWPPTGRRRGGRSGGS